MWRSFQNLKDVGVVQVKVIRAEGLMAADVTGKTETLSRNNRLTAPKSVIPTCLVFGFFNVIKDVQPVA